jgi:hypothetical protein
MLALPGALTWLQQVSGGKPLLLSSIGFAGRSVDL